MTIETIERYIQDLEAIKNYPRVVQERDKLSKKVEKLKANRDKTLKELSSLKTLKANLDGPEMTLEEARLDFIQAQDAEIERRAADSFGKLKANYDSRMPQLVYQRLCRILEQSRWPEEIAKLIDAEAEKKANTLLRDENNWPGWFRKLYQEEVTKKVSSGLNEEFNARVETAAIGRAQERLKQLISTEWPAWYQANAEPKLTELETKVNENALQVLRGPWMFSCDRCGTSFSSELTSLGIEDLLRRGYVEIQCSNQVCEDRSFFSTRRHTFRVSLHDLIDLHIGG